MATIADLNVAFGADLTGLEAGFAKVEGQVNSFGSKLGGIAAGFAGLFAIDKLVGFGTAAITTAGDLQALEKGFAATYKGSEDLSVALAKVKDLAKLPGLGLKEALQGATNLQAAGFSADLATRALGAFGNALATVGKGKADLDGVGLALSQIASKGKISAEEINQLAERVPQIRVAMQAAFGTADTTALQKAKISATDFVEGVTRELEKLPKVTGGIKNALENFSDATTTALGKVGDTLNKSFDIEGLVNIASGLLADLGDAFAKLEPTFRSVAVYFSSNGEGGQLFTALGASVNDTAKAFTNLFGVLNGGENSAGFLKGLVRELTTGLTNFSDVVGGLVDSLTGLFSGDFARGNDGADRFFGGLERSMRNFIGLSQELKGSFADAFSAKSLNPDNVDYFGDEVSKATDKVKAFAIEVQSKAAKALDDIRKSLRDNENAARALGDNYDYVGGKVSILTSGVKKLTDLGFAPGGAVVQRYAAMLNLLPTALDRALGSIKAAAEGKLDVALRVPTLNVPGQDLKTTLKPLVFPPLDNSKFKKTLTDTEEIMRDFNKRGENILAAGLATIASTFFKGIGELATGSITAEQFGGGLLAVIGQVCTQLGEAAIGIGISMLAIKFSFNNPYTAIAAGAALLILGAALGSIANNALSVTPGGEGSGGGGASIASAPRSNFTPTTAPGAADGGRPPAVNIHDVKFVLQGSELIGAIKIQTDRLGRVVGR